MNTTYSCGHMKIDPKSTQHAVFCAIKCDACKRAQLGAIV